MTTKTATAEWSGNLEDGHGSFHFGDKNRISEPYSFNSRFEEGLGTGPEDLIAAAHAGCYSMALSHLLDEADEKPERVVTSADVALEKDADGFAITRIKLKPAVLCPGITEEKLNRLAEEAAQNCPVSKAMAGAEISVEAVFMDERGELGV